MCVNVGLSSQQTIDEILASALTSSPEVHQSHEGDDPPETVIHTELDMMLSLEQYNSLYDKDHLSNSNNGKPLQRVKRKARKDGIYRWTDKEIPYLIDSYDFNDADAEQIYMAMKEWQDYTCITFRERTSFDSNFIRFREGRGCFSFIGMVGKYWQPIYLTKYCRNKAVIIHEIGHAVGFYHEQNRPDRDSYVIINEKHINKDYLYNFMKYSDSEIATLEVPYDYGSIMHYGSRFFSIDKNVTIQTINPAYQEVIGKSQGLSFKDIKLANLMYNCSQGCSPGESCPEDGFRGKDCKCWCPGNPVQPCNISELTQYAQSTPEIVNLNTTGQSITQASAQPVDNSSTYSNETNADTKRTPYN